MFSKVPHGQIKEVINFAFWSDIYRGWLLHPVWYLNFIYPAANLKLSTLNMFSKVPHGQIKEVINFAFWSDIYRGWLLHPVWYLNFIYPAANLKLSAEDLNFQPRILISGEGLSLDLKTSLKTLDRCSWNQISGRRFHQIWSLN